MGLIEDPFPNVQNGDVADASQLNARLQALFDLVNGALDSENASAALQQLLKQPGEISMTYADTPDPGHLMCDSSFVSQATYPKLFARIGHKANGGVDPGDGTFRLPGLNKGRVPVGKDAAQAEFDTIGKTGGEKTHGLTVAELAAHDHGGVTKWGNQDLNAHGHSGVSGGENSSLSHQHQMNSQPTAVPGRTAGSSWTYDNPSTGINQSGGGTVWNRPAYSGPAGMIELFATAFGAPAAHTHNVTVGDAGGMILSEHDHDIQSQGGGQAHNNLQPFEVVNYQIKT